MLLIIAASFFISFSSYSSPKLNHGCELGLLLKIDQKNIKASFIPMKNTRLCLSKYKYKNFPINFNILSDDVLIRNALTIDKIKKMINEYPSVIRTTLFNHRFKNQNNFFEFKNNINKIFKSTTGKVRKDFLKKSFELDFQLNTEKYFKKKRTSIVLKTEDSIELKGINNFKALDNWTDLDRLHFETTKKKFTHYTNTPSKNKLLLENLNNSSQNIFITETNLFEDKFFMDKKTKIVRGRFSDLDKIQLLDDNRLKTFIKKIKKSNFYFYQLDWEKYFYIINT